MKTGKLLLTIFAMVTLVSCGGGQRKSAQQNADAECCSEYVGIHTSENSLDWAGTYEGTLPCADCPGIQTVLTLNADNTFVLTSTYIDRENGTFQDTGSFKWIDGRNIELDLGRKGKQYFWVREGSLQMLDLEQNVITGPNADHYFLMKRACC